MTFFFLSLLFMYVGRKLGWALSKSFLYPLPEPGCVLISMAWGGIIAFAMCLLIEWQHPNIVLKIIFGYMLGAYVAIPNFGLLNEATIPPEALPKHQRFSTWPMLTYICVSIVGGWITSHK